MKFTERGIQKINEYMESYSSPVKCILKQQEDSIPHPMVWQKWKD